MKKSILIIILLLSIRLYSQECDNQTFKITDFYLLNSGNSKSDKGGLTFSFDISASHIVEDAYKKPYYINIRILDAGTNLVFQEDRVRTFYAKKDFFDETKIEAQYVKVVIPFEKINVKSGKQQLQLQISAENDNKQFPVFFKKTILVKIPEMYDYSEQVFNVASFVVQQKNENNVAGLSINFKYLLKFDVSQIKDLKEHPEFGNYVFYLKFFNNTNNSEIELFDDKNTQKTIRPLLKENYLEMFVPFSDLKLKKGNYSLKVKLCARTGNGLFDAGEILSQDININQPQLYVFTFDLIHSSIQDNNYDTGSVLGQVFSSSTSNKGKGYPDVYWMIKTGNIIKYISPVWDNVLLAPTGKASVIIAENDPLQFVVYDRDFPSQDDFIGRKIIENINGEFDKTENSYKNGGLYDASFSYSKKQID